MVAALEGGTTRSISSAYLRIILWSISALRSEMFMTKLVGPVTLP